MAGNKHEIGAVLTLRDNMSAVLRGVKREQNSFKKDVADTRTELEKTFKKKTEARLDATKAHQTITKLKEKTESLREKIVTAVAYKDMVSRKINKTKNVLASLGRRVFSPVVAIKDKATSAIKNIGSKLAGLAKFGVAGGIAALGAGGISALKSGAELEQQQVAMGHFIGSNNKGKSEAEINQMRDSFMKDLRENSNVTPFTSSEVISAGTRALGVTGGNTKDAMELVKVAEDMAALTPGKTVKDAMEALADAKNGETERLKEFNAKVSAEEFNQLGFKGVVDTKLKSQFDGGAAKLSNTGAGLLSTIKGKIGSKAQDLGLSAIEKAKPLLQGVIKILDSPTLSNISKKVGEGISYIGEKFTTFGQKFSWITEKASFFKEVFNSSWEGAKDVIEKTRPIIEPIFSIIADGCKIVFDAFQMAFPYIRDIVGSVWDFVSPILSKFADGLGWMAEKVSGVANWVESKVGGKKSKNATVDGSHANGLKNVPFDGYIARLHKGEAVIPAAMNPYTNGTTNNSNSSEKKIEININGVNKSTSEILNEIIPPLKLMISNM